MLDLELGDARRVGRDVLTRLRDRLGHLVEDVNPTLASLPKCLGHDLTADRVDLGVHLERGDAVLGSCDLEVHVAEVILVAQDVGEDCEVIAFLDQAHRDSSHWRLEGHSSVHQREG